MNVALFVAPIDYSVFGTFAYPGIFLLTFVANASVVVPIPYIPIIVRVAGTVPSIALLILVAAAGSMLGEAVAFFVGRAGKRTVEGSRVYRAIERVRDRPVVAWLLLFVLAAPLNPFFDVAGLAAGALGVPFRIFASSVLLGRIVRFAGIIWIGLGIARL